ncbi:MAG: ACT domain-containing protein [Clostridia bacterium]|nr:ACT domain-containing protein [Clostridia bacterium]
MTLQKEYYLIDKSVLPEIFSKVIEAKRLLQTGQCKTVNDAAKTVQISRSVFYKYKDSVHVFVEKDKQNIITIILYLSDEIGSLSRVLNLISSVGANILTINQNVPMNGIAPVSISFVTSGMNLQLEELFSQMERLSGVISVKPVAKERG